MAPADEHSIKFIDLVREISDGYYGIRPVGRSLRKIRIPMQIDGPEAAGQFRFRNKWKQEITKIPNIKGSGYSNLKHEELSNDILRKTWRLSR